MNKHEKRLIKMINDKIEFDLKYYDIKDNINITVNNKIVFHKKNSFRIGFAVACVLLAICAGVLFIPKNSKEGWKDCEYDISDSLSQSKASEIFKNENCEEAMILFSSNSSVNIELVIENDNELIKLYGNDNKEEVIIPNNMLINYQKLYGEFDVEENETFYIVEYDGEIYVKYKKKILPLEDLK